MLPLIISFYTPDWTYPTHAKRLKKECDNLNLESRIEERDSRGGYLQNTCIKPEFIRDMLHEEKRPVLWIDVDGSIYKRPTFFDSLDADFAAKRMDKNRKRAWHVGTMWFDYNPLVLDFVDQWIEITGELSDESSLEATWKHFPSLKISDIPEEYFRIEHRRKAPPADTVIMHRLSESDSKRQQAHLFSGDRAQSRRP
jgi:hypothetical protein